MRELRILIAHCRYQQPGGEDLVVAAEKALLEQHGHKVWLYERNNLDVERMGRTQLASESVWSSRTEREVTAMIDEYRPDLIHVHNTFPLISPSLYWTAESRRIPVVQTLHNFRLLCPQAMLLRAGQVCEDCLGKSTWRAVVHKCYRESATASAVATLMLTVHRRLGTFRDKIARYIALNKFSRNKFIEGGLPRDKIVIKPNFVDLPARFGGVRSGGLFVGRLSPEKGIKTLLGALAKNANIEFEIIGDGPEPVDPGVRRLTWQSQELIYERMRRAAYLVIPSLWYETGPRTLMEAFGCGLPVVASRLGAIAEQVDEGETGLLFAPGSAEELSQKIAWAESNPEEMARMGRRARSVYEARYTPAKNYQRLVEIYSEAMEVGFSSSSSSTKNGEESNECKTESTGLA
jgi:glycosyltransferase involved in cell wall biosynthesis